MITKRQIKIFTNNLLCPKREILFYRYFLAFCYFELSMEINLARNEPVHKDVDNQ